MIAPLLVQPLHGLDGPGDYRAFAGVVDVVVVQRQQGVATLLDVGGDVAHQRIEVLGPLHQVDGKDQFRVFGVPGFDGDLVPGEQVPGAEPELQGVAQVDRDGHGCVVTSRSGRTDCGVGRQDPGRSRRCAATG